MTQPGFMSVPTRHCNSNIGGAEFFPFFGPFCYTLFVLGLKFQSVRLCNPKAALHVAVRPLGWTLLSFKKSHKVE